MIRLACTFWLIAVAVGFNQIQAQKVVGIAAVPGLQERLVSQPASQGNQPTVAPATAAAASEQQSAEKSFLGLNLGIGLGVSLDLDGGSQIDEAVVDGAGIVRVTKESDEDPRVLFEVHKFFEKKPGCFTVADSNGQILTVSQIRGHVQPPDCPSSPATSSGSNPALFSGKQDRVTNWGHGPFAAIQTSSDSAISSFAMGYMVGFRRQTGNNSSSNSFNIGLGVIWDRDIKTLADGVVENQPLPEGVSEILFRTETRTGLVLLTSFSF